VTNSLLLSILSGFAVYNLVMLLSKSIVSAQIKRRIEKFDQSACTFIPVIGLVLFVINIAYLYSEIKITTDQNEGDLLQRITGPYWYAYWFQYLLYLSPVLLWIKTLRNYVVLRIFISLIILFPLERVVIYFTPFHRDYQPSNWTMSHLEQTINWFWHIGVFCVVAIVFHLIRRMFEKREK
jgi:hypothetical protein